MRPQRNCTEIEPPSGFLWGVSGGQGSSRNMRRTRRWLAVRLRRSRPLSPKAAESSAHLCCGSRSPKTLPGAGGEHCCWHGCPAGRAGVLGLAALSMTP